MDLLDNPEAYLRLKNSIDNQSGKKDEVHQKLENHKKEVETHVLSAKQEISELKKVVDGVQQLQKQNDVKEIKDTIEKAQDSLKRVNDARNQFEDHRKQVEEMKNVYQDVRKKLEHFESFDNMMISMRNEHTNHMNEVQKHLSDIRKAAQENKSNDDQVKNLTEMNRKNTEELKRALEENNRNDERIKKVVEDVQGNYNTLRRTLENNGSQDENNKIMLLNQIESLGNRIYTLETGGVKNGGNNGNGNGNNVEVLQKLNDLNKNFEEYKQVTNERIEKLLKLFLSINK